VAANAFDVGGGYVDLRIQGADATDTVNAKFYYPSTVTGANETALTLQYYDGTAWAVVRSSGGGAPAKDTTNDLDGTVSGGRFAVTFDDTSTPKVTELTGTVFTAAGSPNQPPVAKCANVTVAADATCTANASVDGGSYDPDGDPITVSQSPGPYPLGTTVLTLTVTDSAGASASCTATVTVADETAPAVQCVAANNPGGGTPNSRAGFYRVSAQEACLTASLRLGSYTLADGETIKLTEAPGSAGVTLLNAMGSIRHFKVGAGQATITAVDSVGNAATAACPVPPGK
jgi:hypothetical protein